MKTIDEDYAYEMMRQKRIDDMSEAEFFRVFHSIQAGPDKMDEQLKELEHERMLA